MSAVQALADKIGELSQGIANLDREGEELYNQANARASRAAEMRAERARAEAALLYAMRGPGTDDAVEDAIAIVDRVTAEETSPVAVIA